jgi:hypothetical protein
MALLVVYAGVSGVTIVGVLICALLRRDAGGICRGVLRQAAIAANCVAVQVRTHCIASSVIGHRLTCES